MGDSAATVRMAGAIASRLGYGPRMSSLYRTQPHGFLFQPPFCNAVVELWTNWPPDRLLDLLFRVEVRFGRRRGMRWGSRTLDVDLLLYGEAVQSGPRLILPHPRLMERRFVLEPLVELNPSLVLPGGCSVRKALARTLQQEVARW